MANVKITLDYQINDGMSLTFKAPCDCTAVTGLIVYYPTITEDASTTTSKTFTFKDAHGNDLTSIGNLFTTNAYVKVVLDTTNGVAYIQNADTNGYIENTMAKKADMDTKLDGKAPATHASQHVSGGSDPITPEAIGARPDTWTPTATDVGARPDTWMPSIGEVSPQCVYRTNSNADELLDFWVLGNGTNYPGSNFWYVNTVFYAGVSLTSNRRQMAYDYTNNGYIYERIYKNGTWTSWNRVYTAANNPAYIKWTRLGSRSLNVTSTSKGYFEGFVDYSAYDFLLLSMKFSGTVTFSSTTSSSKSFKFLIGYGYTPSGTSYPDYPNISYSKEQTDSTTTVTKTFTVNLMGGIGNAHAYSDNMNISYGSFGNEFISDAIGLLPTNVTAIDVSIIQTVYGGKFTTF